MNNTHKDYIQREAEKAESQWGKSYNILWKIINKMNLRIGAEIGVAYGGHSLKILENTNSRLYSIDSYRHIPGYQDPMNKSQGEFDALFEYAKNRLNKFGKRSVMIRKSSQEAIKDVRGMIDYVYIDADHSYEGVKTDIERWFCKIRDGGIISGHDYGHSNFPGVKKAVDEYFSRFGWVPNTHKSGVWWIEKKPLNISYIMPAYNCENTIIESVESIYNNWKEGYELVIVDDGSEDNTLSKIKYLKNKFPNIKLVKHLYNKGGGAARNTAIENSKHPLIFCLDSDNILKKNSISELMQYYIKSNYEGVSFQSLKYFKNNINKISHIWKFTQPVYNKTNYLSTNIVPGASGNYLFSKSSWSRCNGYPTYAGALDTWGFGYRQIIKDSQIGVMPNSYYYHRLSSNSYWLREISKHNSSVQALRIILEDPSVIRGKDLSRIMLSKHLYSWFTNLSNNPITIIKPSLADKKISTRLYSYAKKLLFRLGSNYAHN